MQLPLTLLDDRLLVGRHTTISFNRTLRIPEDGKRYNLPAGFGRLPILRVEDVADRVPSKWRQEGGLIIPLYQREALFLEFGGVDWRPTISKVAVGRINAITGKPHDLQLKAGRQDYVVIPEQKWLDGINSGNGTVRQFVAMPLSKGYTVEAQITDEETHGGFQLAVFDPKQGIFSEPQPEKWEDYTFSYREDGMALHARAPRIYEDSHSLFSRSAGPKEGRDLEMGIAAGGSIKQQILEDEYGIETWDASEHLSLNIRIVNSAVYEEITGNAAPPTPITTEAYAKNGIPWFSQYEETRKSVPGAKIFNQLLSVLQIDKARGIKTDEATSTDFKENTTVAIKTATLVERINELREKVNTSYIEKRFAECLTHSRRYADLLEAQERLLITSDEGPSIKELASTAFLTAGDCAAQLGQLEEAEDLANRALNLHVSDRALSLRLFTRVQSKNWEMADLDCRELLHRNPTHEYAKQIKALLGSEADKDAASNPDAADKREEIPSFPLAKKNEAIVWEIDAGGVCHVPRPQPPVKKP